MKIKKGMVWGELCGDDVQTLYDQALPLESCNGEDFEIGKCLICFFDTTCFISGEVLDDLSIYIDFDAVFI